MKNLSLSFLNYLQRVRAIYPANAVCRLPSRTKRDSLLLGIEQASAEIEIKAQAKLTNINRFN